MTTMASQITSLTVVYSTVYSEADQRKHQSSASLAFVWGIHRDQWITRTKSQLRGKCFHLMTSSCKQILRCNLFKKQHQSDSSPVGETFPHFIITYIQTIAYDSRVCSTQVCWNNNTFVINFRRGKSISCKGGLFLRYCKWHDINSKLLCLLSSPFLK